MLLKVLLLKIVRGALCRNMVIISTFISWWRLQNPSQRGKQHVCHSNSLIGSISP